MKTGDLVKWSLNWIANSRDEEREMYRQDIGIVCGKSEDLNRCFWIAWSNGRVDEVHVDYLEII